MLATRPSHASLRRAVLVLACALVGASAAAGLGAPRKALIHEELSACTGVGVNVGAPTIIENPQAALLRPRDGRINGYNFSLTVNGFADSPCIAAVHAGFADYVAPPGESVVMVSFNLQMYGSSSDLYTPDLSFVIDGSHVVHFGQAMPGRSTVELDAPSHATVALAASEVGLTQELSLSSGDRLPPAPEALYRSENGPSLIETMDKRAVLRIVDSSDGFSETDTLQLDSVGFTYFSPVNSRVHPSNVHGAFLLVHLSETQPPQGDQVDWLRAIPPDRMRLVLPGGAFIGPDPASTEASKVWSLVDGTYFFDVPASFTKGTLEVAPGPNPAYELTYSRNKRGEVDVLGTAAFSIDLPPAPKLATGVTGEPATGGATSGQGRSRTTSDTRGTGHASGNLRTVVLIATSSVLVPVLLVFVVPVFVRRRQRKRGPYAVDAGGVPIDVPGPLPPALLGPAAETGATQSGAATRTGESPPPLATVTGPDKAEPATAVTNDTAGSQGRPAPSFRVLGAVEAVGLELPTKRLVVVELLVFLACMKSRRFTPDEIMAELWPLGEDGAETVSRTSFQKYMTYARRSAGLAAFPKAEAGRLSIGAEVTTDWEAFQVLVERAKAAAADDAIELLVATLGLVRGPAFSGVPKGRYAWAERGLITEIEVAVIAAAERLAELCLESGQAARAVDGIERALRATKDPRVADDLLSLAGATGDLGTLERAWRDVEAIVGTEAAARLRRSYEAIRRRLVEADELVG